MKGNILLVEDDESLGFVTSDSIQHEGYAVTWAKNGTDGENEFLKGTFDLCILDVMLPYQDGFNLAKKIRAKNEFVPILFLTARSMEQDRLKGFEIGGDDYIPKPFSLPELIYRIKVFMRRSERKEEMSSAENESIIGEYKFQLSNLTLSHHQEVLNLTKIEADLLAMLFQNKNALVKREDILVEIWGENDYFKGRSLDVFISRLRKYLNQDDSIEIKNHHGVGFQLCIN
ncbi:MAG: response regulator transcription factor [Cyclobacteriaceae bacterium]